MAAGEATCALVHGANRLGAYSLLDIVVFGHACANRVAEIHQPGEKQKTLEKDAGEKHPLLKILCLRTIAWLDKLRNSKGSIPTSKIRLNMQRVMQNNAAVFRTQETLEEGCQLIDKAWESFHDVKLNDRSLIWNSNLIETFELENLLINAFITMHSVEARKESSRDKPVKILRNGGSEVGVRRQKSLTHWVGNILKNSASREHTGGKGSRSLCWSLMPQSSRRSKRAWPNNVGTQFDENVSGGSSDLPATQLGQEERR